MRYLMESVAGNTIVIKLLFLVLSLSAQTNSFVKEQQRYKRFRTAEKEKLQDLKLLFHRNKLDLNQCKLFLRSFKKEKELELWVFSETLKKYILLKIYDICENSGSLGPKREQGDSQVPEGVYYIDRFNPFSNFYLSLGLNYPNKSDKRLGLENSLGGDIFIHGNCVTIGCIPIEDNSIKELYVSSVYAKNSGQAKIPVHLFPTRMDENGMKFLETISPNLQDFWKNLRDVYMSFESDKIPNNIRINKSGKYIVN
jgi:murein L,D-transpeptidase YafK